MTESLLMEIPLLILGKVADHFEKRYPRIVFEVFAGALISIFFVSNIYINQGIIMLPDEWFGFDGDDLYGFYEGLGSTLQKAYMRTAMIDFFIIMPLYFTVLGSWLYHIASKTKHDKKLSLLFAIAVIGDLFETFVLQQACLVHPDRLSNSLIALGSLGQKVKWISVGIGLLLTLYFHAFAKIKHM